MACDSRDGGGRDCVEHVSGPEASTRAGGRRVGGRVTTGIAAAGTGPWTLTRRSGPFPCACALHRPGGSTLREGQLRAKVNSAEKVALRGVRPSAEVRAKGPVNAARPPAGQMAEETSSRSMCRLCTSGGGVGIYEPKHGGDRSANREDQ